MLVTGAVAAAEAAMVLVVVSILIVVVAVIVVVVVVVVVVGKVATKNHPRILHAKVIYLSYIYHIDTQ